jgi:hypothetical protein
MTTALPVWRKRAITCIDILAHPLRINMRDDLVEDFGGAILDRPNDTEQHSTGDPVPGAVADLRVAFEALVAFELTLAQWPGEQAIAMGFAPPARPGQGKTPEGGFIFIEHNDLTAAGPGLEGRECERGPRQLSGVRSEQVVGRLC